MNSRIKKLPASVQHIICASNQINSYTKAVQELVFNSLDADATSIAVRIHIPEGSIQVVDNGFGISQADFKYIGQNYITSKIVDISTLKSAPNKYGFQGQSLANLSQISETLKVTSRFYKCETTCVKAIEYGRPKSTAKCTPRPSKGTTVEIKGFLYNRNIRKKTVDLINELQSIKTFLEHISLVHPSISLSLRDDSKNQIVYKIHKNRDMYQTLYTLYEIERTNLQELQVEKNQYKVKAYVGKHGIEIDRRLIFLNGKFIDLSPLYKKVNDNFKKHLNVDKMKNKKNVINGDENHTFANKIPFYILFIICPYMDYELTNTVLEFKDWGPINILLDKLVKLFTGNIQLKIAPKNQVTGLNNETETEITRNRIENIMQRILGSHHKPEISKMHNGIKGKIIQRKIKNKKKSLDLSQIVHSKQSNDKKKRSKQFSCDRVMHQESTATKKYSNIMKKQSKPGKVTNRRKHDVSSITSSKTHVEKLNRTRIQKKTYPEQSERATSKKFTTQKQFHINNNITKTKQIDKLCKKKILSLHNKFAMETESVKRKCELLAQQTKELIKNNKINPKVLLNENVQYTHSNFDKNNKNISVHKKVNEIIIHEYIPLPPKLNTDIQVSNYQNKKTFISNYDLLQTIISSQEFGNREQQIENMIVRSDSHAAMVEPDKMTPIDKESNSIPPYQAIMLNRNNISSFRATDDPIPYEAETPRHNLKPFTRESNFVSSFQAVTSDQNGRECDDCFLAMTHNRNHMPDISPLQAEKCNSHNMPYLNRASDNGSPFEAVTYQSHNYIDHDFRTDSEVEINHFFKKSRNFITTQSRENFLIQTNFPENNRFRKNNINLWSKLLYSHKQRNFNKSLNKSAKMLDMNNIPKSIQESYTIEFTESNKYQYTPTEKKYRSHNLASNITTESINSMTQSMNCIFNDPRFERESTKDPKTWFSLNNNVEKNNDMDYEPINEKTFTITDSYRASNIHLCFNHETWNNDGTYTIDGMESQNISCLEIETFNLMQNNANSSTNFVFISKSQENIENSLIMNPINVCETVLNDQEQQPLEKTREFDIISDCSQDICNNVSVNNDDINGIGDPKNELNDTMNAYFLNIVSNEKYVQKAQNKVEEISHHFTIPNSNGSDLRQNPLLISKANVVAHESNKDLNTIDDTTKESNETEPFILRNRLFFVPKGMSPIFEGCQTKPNLDYDPKEDYYEEIIYNNFVEKVQNDAEIFKPRIRETSDLTTKDISKANNKMNKTIASLKFNGLSIKNAKVLGQVDGKFIAATMKGECNKIDVTEEFLVLFDQHAVHERIRLENNLADYLTGTQWKSVIIDEVSLKMSRDNILYLHNYRDKFTQFGLEWTILNYDEISITAIPEGILGKNPRQVDKIIKAVKSLITEEINMIQMQRGCVSLYPKSIIDLVFSEACRYAIKFGDRLSKSQCVELLNGLSDCKTPFQCAHGRPAMAVIMNIESCKADYKKRHLLPNSEVDIETGKASIAKRKAIDGVPNGSPPLTFT